MSQFKFGDFEIEVDVTDVVFVERYEEAVERYNESIKKVPVDGKVSDKIRAMCSVFFETFDLLFGAGVSQKMFGDKVSVDLCVTAFRQLVGMVNDYTSTVQKMQITPAPKPVNRQQRRAKK